MVTLMKRATKGQHKVWRIIKGAVRDTAHVHQIELPYHFCTSVAKRATGTLTANMPDVLAAASVSVRQKVEGSPQGQPQTAKAGRICKGPAGRSHASGDRSAKGPRLTSARRGPLLRFLKDAPQVMWWLKHNDPIAYDHMQKALSLIGRTVGRMDAAGVD